MNMRHATLGIFLAFALVLQAGAEDLSFGLSLGASADSAAVHPLYPAASASIDVGNDPLAAFAAISLVADGKYGSAASGGYLGGASVLMEDCGLRYSGERLIFEAGRISFSDVVADPYSLFISSNPVHSLGARYAIVGNAFRMDSRWISLTERSAKDYPDRGSVVKTYELDLGKLRLAYEDACVYTANAGDPTVTLRTSNFDAEYFLNPLPGFFIQYLNVAASPRSMRQNDNAIMGGLVEWEEEAWSAHLQFLVDDINLNRFFKPEARMIPDKVALSFGADLETEAGHIAFNAAMATKYTFESYGSGTSDCKYGYTYVPDVAYQVAGDARAILLEDNMVGFRLGENALGLRLDWDRAFDRLKAAAALELTVKGDQSPANPWHSLTDAPYETEFLNDALLETRLVASGRASWNLGDLDLRASCKLGYVWNPQALVSASDGGAAIYRAQAGGAALWSLSLGLAYKLGFSF